MLEKLTEEDVLKAEEYFHVKLPKEYVDVLRIQNGGYLLKESIDISVQIEGEDILQLESLFGVKEDKGLMESVYLLKEWGIDDDHLIVIAGDGHYFIALDYSGDNNHPKVAYIISETGERIELFPTFHAFLQKLIPEENVTLDDYEKESKQFSQNPTLEAAKKLISSENEDLMHHGIAYWQSTGKDQTELNGILLHTVANTPYLSIQLLVAGILWEKVASGEIKEELEIQNVIDCIPDSPLDIVKDYKQKIVDEKNALAF